MDGNGAQWFHSKYNGTFNITSEYTKYKISMPKGIENKCCNPIKWCKVTKFIGGKTNEKVNQDTKVHVYTVYMN